MGRDDTKTHQQPDARETKQFWSKMWQPREHYKKSIIDKIYDKRIRTRKRPESENTNRFTQNNTKKISNWKTPGYVGIHGFRFKKVTSIHDRLELEMNRYLQEAHVPEWITKGKTTLIQKDPLKGTAPNNYRPIACLPMMWKILTAQIREDIYYMPISRGLFPEEQKGCRKGSRSTGGLLYIDQHIINESKTRRKNLPMA